MALTLQEQLDLEAAEKRHAKILGRNTKLQKKSREELAQLEDKINKLKKKGMELTYEAASLEKQLLSTANKKNKAAAIAGISGKANVKNLQAAYVQEAKFSKLSAQVVRNLGDQLEGNEELTDMFTTNDTLISSMGSGVYDLSQLNEELLRIQEEKRRLGDQLGEDEENYFNNLEKSIKLRMEIQEAEAKQEARLSAADDLTGGMASKANDMMATFKKLGPVTGSFVVGLGLATLALVEFSENLDAIGKSFGAIGLQNKEFRDNLLASSAEATKLGKGLEDVVEAITTLTSEFGVGFKEAQSMANEVISMSMGLGLTTAEGGNLIGVLSTIAGLSNDTSVALAQQTTLLAESNDVAPQAVLQDIASSSETVAKFTHAGAKNIMEGAIQARKLGIDLETAASAAESMLDFQTAIEDAMTASVMVGRQINIQKLQELSLAGDLKGVALEQRRLLGDQESFLAMNVLQREALAKAVGLSVGQATKMLDKEEDMVTLAGELAKQEGFEKLIGPEAISSMTKMLGTLKSIGAELVNVFGPILNVIVGAVSGILGIITTVADWVAYIPGVLATWATHLGPFAFILTNIARLIVLMAAYKAFTSLAAIPVVGAVLGGIAAASIIASGFSAIASAKEGGITTEEGAVNVHPQEAIIPLSKLAGFMADAMSPVVASVNKLNEDFTNKHVPSLAKSNEAGGKKAGREIGRQFQMNMA